MKEAKRESETDKGDTSGTTGIFQLWQKCPKFMMQLSRAGIPK